MYDELVKRLRYCSEEQNGCGMCALSSNCVLRVGLLTQAADAIEELVATVGTAYNELANNEANKPRWIPVTERLPEKHQWCLVVGENLYDMDFINSLGGWTIHNKPQAPIDYWMPLPEPPKEEV